MNKNHAKLFNYLSYKLRQACNWTQISLPNKQKLCKHSKRNDEHIFGRNKLVILRRTTSSMIEVQGLLKRTMSKLYISIMC